MNIALYDHPQIRVQMLPFTYTRPIADILIGIYSIKDKWQHYLNQSVSHITEDYLSEKFRGPGNNSNLLVINGGIIPDQQLVDKFLSLKNGEAISKNGMLIAARFDTLMAYEDIAKIKGGEYKNDVLIISRPWHIFKEVAEQIRNDFELITKGRTSQVITDKHTIVYGEENIFIEEGVNIKASILNAEKGPIYLSRNSIVEEGALIRGPFFLGEGSRINAKARMRGDTAIGPHCKVGGEVSNSVIFGYTNKGHDGFLGNSVLGEWCNIGADTNISNLKNNYTKVKVWDFENDNFIDTGEQFCGLFMGDHCKTGINTMFNTGTVTGVSANVFGAGFPRSFIPSFSWGGHSELTTYDPDKMKEVAAVSMSRRDAEYNELDEAILDHLFKSTKKYRDWEH